MKREIMTFKIKQEIAETLDYVEDLRDKLVNSLKKGMKM